MANNVQYLDEDNINFHNVKATDPLPVVDTAVTALLAPATDAVAITPSDSTVLAAIRGIAVGGGGTIVATMASGDVTFTVVAGQLLPIKPSKVKAASTATGLVGLI